MFEKPLAGESLERYTISPGVRLASTKTPSEEIPHGIFCHSALGVVFTISYWGSDTKGFFQYSCTLFANTEASVLT